MEYPILTGPVSVPLLAVRDWVARRLSHIAARDSTANATRSRRPAQGYTTAAATEAPASSWMYSMYVCTQVRRTHESFRPAGSPSIPCRWNPADTNTTALRRRLFLEQSERERRRRRLLRTATQYSSFGMGNTLVETFARSQSVRWRYLLGGSAMQGI